MKNRRGLLGHPLMFWGQSGSYICIICIFLFITLIIILDLQKLVSLYDRSLAQAKALKITYENNFLNLEKDSNSIL